MKKFTAIIVSLALVCFAAPVYAFHQPPVNLGFTNFIDGASPGPGWYFTEYLQFYYADDLKDGDGDDLPGDNELDLFVSLNQLIYQSDVTFLGGNPGLDVILPIVDVDFDSDTLPLEANDGGFGDLLVGPFIQWGPHMLFGRPYFHRFEFQVIAPTGKHDKKYALNPGSDMWSINPYYSFTYFIAPKLTTSVRFHYLWNSEDKNAGPTPDFQAGQAIHFNYALAYAVTDFLRLGVAGYYLKQLEEDEIDGHKADDSEEEVFAIGPGLVWHITKDLTFMSAVNFETGVENRAEGVRTTLRLIWKFW
ncbi:MAG: transporter [Candidatus Hydrogenedentota bacterium]|nr:MAG: transporter [Candidatus Hydrogenedentota bacterium]